MAYQKNKKLAPFRYLIYAGLVLCSLLNYAQAQGLEISGTIVETQSNQPVEFATVVVKSSVTNDILTGTTSDIGGIFLLRTDSSKVFVEISFIGFSTQTIRDLRISNGKANLGVIRLEPDDQLLDEITVEGEKSTMEFELDKKVFNVGKDITSTGMSALEVLNNVPSVTVSIEGDIRLRGSSGVQVLIDGKPSILADGQTNALGTITADMIEKIEVITNPSAKYDAEGTSGILNIVLKKEEKKGLNGSLSVNTGEPDNHSVGISLNRRTEKFNLFAQLGAGYRSLPRDSESINRDKINDNTVTSDGTSYRNETFYNIILGTDYHINRYNVLTLSGNFAYEIEEQPSLFNFSYQEQSNPPQSEWTRSEVTEATNPKWQFDLNYSKEFKDDEEHILLISLLGRFFGKDQSSVFTNTPIFGDVFFDDQQTETKFQQADYTLKLDYTDPITEKVTIEAGTQYVINDVGNDYEVRNLEDGQWVTVEDLTNNFEYDQKVLGIYGTGSYEGKTWGAKLGLRMEATDLNTLLKNTNEENEQNYLNLFPTLHTSYKLTQIFSLQAGYSRRIYRPRLWDLNPFFNIRNNFNIRKGNPNLQPEYTDSYEVTGILNLENASVNGSLYHRYTTDVIERISFVENNVNTTIPMNIGTSKMTGIELNIKYEPIKWLTLSGDFNYGIFTREGDLEGQSFDFDGDQWTSRINAKINLPAQIDLELTGNFESGYQTVQQQLSRNDYADVGIRKKIIGGKGVINLSVRDVFASRVARGVIDEPEYYLYTRDTRGRFFTLGFSYGFGKGEAMTYSGSRRF
ncbi:MAG: TonB-dependent receptor [Cyclobacteriaceae bacterium]|nr:MAG: TonB-dependent receptor [Cyclobacteriaceae bacterium]